MEEKSIQEEKLMLSLTYRGPRAQRFITVRQVETAGVAWQLLDFYFTNRRPRKWKIVMPRTEKYAQSEARFSTGEPSMVKAVLILICVVLYIVLGFLRIREMIGLTVTVALLIGAVYKHYLPQFYESKDEMHEAIKEKILGLFFFRGKITVWVPLQRLTTSDIELPPFIHFILYDAQGRKITTFRCKMQFCWLKAFDFLKLKDKQTARKKNLYVAGKFGVGKSSHGNRCIYLTGVLSPFQMAASNAHVSKALQTFSFHNYGLNIDYIDMKGVGQDFTVAQLRLVISGAYRHGEENFQLIDIQTVGDAALRAAHYVMYIVTSESLAATGGNEEDQENCKAVCDERRLNLDIGVSKLTETYPEITEMIREGKEEELLEWADVTFKQTPEYKKLTSIYGPEVQIFPLFPHPPDRRSYTVDLLTYRFLNRALDKATSYIINGHGKEDRISQSVRL